MARVDRRRGRIARRFLLEIFHLWPQAGGIMSLIDELLRDATADQLRNVLAASSLTNSEILRLFLRYAGAMNAAKEENAADVAFARQLGIKL